ncbi:nicotinate-nucleotide--dimethylbenzimidazole phosphoribosyltransferase [Rivibacter subsaxonicus]|uniref:Nicotinate-nucleotide--dimethylbenzimidazole phosphoribosyltransferase n=1 Tax=Rivibacter subsaxonicus TaxID=457575 RepID=A0A4Q7VZV5_9BURK|nr:nicotinate-nucleotide--dimethylbenzimidazole phosphoribosyltransferase [Rivibacter subsaxonicus]RZU02055.1 nicotinate-nucleotide-dimethylbenzimidazole phosphoribosyltransferase [Rivibacter subsaxonicus]
MQRSLIAPTAHPKLEEALRLKLQRRSETTGSLGELEPLAVRLGLIQNSLKPKLKSPQLLVTAGDHGLAVDLPLRGPSSVEQVAHLLGGRLPMAVFSFIQGMGLTVADAGLSETMPSNPSLLQRKIGFGSRNARVAPAMTAEHAHAAIRAGMEIADGLHGNVLACAAIGVGSHESAALVISRLTEVPLRELVVSTSGLSPDQLAQVMVVLQGAQGRHKDLSDPVEVLAAFGGYEIGMLVGAMLVAASKRHLIMVDGMGACAALLVASRIAAPVTDYCVFCRSHGHAGLDNAMGVFGASALLELGLESMDGTGATLAWPLVHASAALLTEVAEGEDPGPTLPASTLVDSGPSTR